MEIVAFDLEELEETMAENGIEDLSQIDNVGMLPTSNFGGMIALTNESGDGVFIQEVWDTGKKEIIETEIINSVTANSEGESVAGFYYESDFYKLNEFMRKNY